MNVIIIDDEKPARENLKRRLQKIDPEINIIDMASSAMEGFISIMNNEPDLIFLDIEMPGGDGFSLLSKFDKIPFDVIFVTAYSEHALKAFELMAIGYITKPIDNQLLTKVYEKSKSRQTSTVDSGMLDELANKIQNLSQSPRVSIPTETGVDLIESDDIVMMQSAEGYTSITLDTGKELLCSKRLKYFEEKLESNFIRMHRSTIINTNHIKTYHKVGFITLNDGRELPVGRKYKAAFAKIFNR